MFYCVLAINDTNKKLDLLYDEIFSCLFYDDYIMFIIQSYYFMSYKLFPLQIISKCDK